jgi:hypothetical protein
MGLETESLFAATGGCDAVPATPSLGPSAAVPGSLAPPSHPARPIIRASAPSRYRVQFTIGQESHDKLRRLQALLRREIPTGDPGLIFERMLDAYLEKVERAKTGGPTAATRRACGSAPSRVRDGLDSTGVVDGTAYGNRIRRAADTRPRHIPAAVKRAVWFRDAGQCAFVSAEGRRCAERAFLELHHIHPFALGGPPTVANIALRCRRHNAHEAEAVFGPRKADSRPPALPVADDGNGGHAPRSAVSGTTRCRLLSAGDPKRARPDLSADDLTGDPGQ